MRYHYYENPSRAPVIGDIYLTQLEDETRDAFIDTDFTGPAGLCATTRFQINNGVSTLYQESCSLDKDNAKIDYQYVAKDNGRGHKITLHTYKDFAFIEQSSTDDSEPDEKCTSNAIGTLFLMAVPIESHHDD